MAGKLALSVDGRTEELEVAGEAGALRVRLGERWHAVELQPTNQGGLYSLLIDGRSWEVFARERPGGYELLIGNRVYDVDVGLGRGRRAAEPEAVTGVWTLVSPMAGQVLEVHVADGDEVEAGQTLAIVESMKMNNELTAARAGTVRDVQVRPGERVEKGRTVLRVE
jgi:acetyl/propionyl-CoA carboxylase alpha subunit